VNDEPVRVLSFEGHSRAVLLVCEREIEVTDIVATEVMRGVYISCGLPKMAREGEPVLPRLVIDAPRDVVILREELYGKPNPKLNRPRPKYPRSRIPDPA